MVELTTVLRDILIDALSDPPTGQIICVLDALDESRMDKMKALVSMIDWQQFTRTRGSAVDVSSSTHNKTL